MWNNDNNYDTLNLIKLNELNKQYRDRRGHFNLQFKMFSAWTFMKTLSLSHMYYFFHVQLNSYTLRHYSDITPRWLTPAASHLVGIGWRPCWWHIMNMVTFHSRVCLWQHGTFWCATMNKQVDITPTKIGQSAPNFTFHKILTLNTSMLKYSVLPIASLTANMTWHDVSQSWALVYLPYW